MTEIADLREKVASRYRITTNGQEYKVQRRNCIGLWRMVKSSCAFTSMNFEWCYASNLKDAEKAMQQNIDREIEKIKARQHGWKPL